MSFQAMEERVQWGVEWLRLLIESLGALVIAAGLVVAVVGLARHAVAARGDGFRPVRLAFARYLTLALELQLAADILSTSVAPSWDSIGKLAAVAVIRTGLNHFLNLEMREESASPSGSPPRAGSDTGAPGAERTVTATGAVRSAGADAGARDARDA